VTSGAGRRGRRLLPASDGLSATTSPSDTTLPPDLEQAAVRRLGHVCLVTAASSAALGFVPSLLDSHAPLHVLSTLPGVIVSLLAYAAVASGRISVRRLLALGLVYEVVLGFFVAVGFHSAAIAPATGSPGWTPVAVWLMVFPLMIPAPTGRTVVATLATAAMDPLGLWVSRAPHASWSDLGTTFLPTLLAAVIAPIAARIVYGLTVEVGRARRLGSYRLVEKLGEGGMGEVWRGRHRMLARSAAIKLIRTSVLGDPSRALETLKRFEREARATAALRSPHTIAVYDFGLAADGIFYYVMELLEGFSLQALVDRFGPVPPERAVRLLRQACHSLDEAHAAGLVHRDVKPANLFVCRLGLDLDFVKVLDFGLVKVQHASATGAEALTGDGGLTGTPGYMAPEIAVGAEFDRRADIYALGCVAYWLLTGHRVFESGNGMQIVVDHVRTPPVPPSRRAGQAFPPGLEQIVMRCLEKDPERRPASAAELSRELEALGIEALWTDARARAWWDEHPPVRTQDLAATTSVATPTRSFAVAWGSRKERVKQAMKS
jgi:eukaryotic-like serine/threonine-protein kinase